MDKGVYYTVREVATRYAVGPSTIWAWVSQGDFPAPIKFSPKVTRWHVEDLLSHDELKRAAKA